MRWASSLRRSSSALLEPLEGRVLLDGQGTVDSATRDQILQAFSASPALFIENAGQWPDQSIHYAFQGSGTNILLTDDGPVFQVFRRSSGDAADNAVQSLAFGITFDGSKPTTPVGLDQSHASVSYVSDDASSSMQSASVYATVEYPGLYDGIDLYTWGHRDHLKYEFHVQPGVDYQQVQLSFQGIQGLTLQDDGSLLVTTDLGVIVDEAPIIYQDIDGQRVTVPGRYRLVDNDTYTFELTGAYDPSHELVLDPDVVWSTFIGGDGELDVATDLAVDSQGNIYLTGMTDSAYFPQSHSPTDTYRKDKYGWVTSSSFRNFQGAFVSKLTQSGGGVSFEWSVFYGSVGQDWYSSSTSVEGRGIAIHELDNGNIDIYTTGVQWYRHYTGDTQQAENQDLWVVDPTEVYVKKITDTRSNGHIVSEGGSVTLAGSGFDEAKDIAVWGSDESLAVYVVGETYVGVGTPSFATGISQATGSIQQGDSDAFIARIDAATMTATKIRFYGQPSGGGLSSFRDSANAIDIANGTIFVTGSTSTVNSTTLAENPTDAFLLKTDLDLENAISQIIVGTGTPGIGAPSAGFDRGTAIVAKYVPTTGTYDVYIAGETASPDFLQVRPHFAGQFLNSTYDAFVAKYSYSSSGFGLPLWSSFIDGRTLDIYQGESDSRDIILGMVLDSAGNILVAGQTFSSELPKNLADPASFTTGSDAFVARLSAMTGALYWTQTMGGPSNDTIGRGVPEPDYNWGNAEDGRPDFDTGGGIALTDDNGQFYICGRAVAANGPNHGHDYEFPVLNSNDSLLGMSETPLGIVVPGEAFIRAMSYNDLPTPVGIVINNGFAGRSVLFSLDVVFDEDVFIPEGVTPTAELTLHNYKTDTDIVVSTFTYSSSSPNVIHWDLPSQLSTVSDAYDGFYTATISFSGWEDSTGNSVDGDGDEVSGGDYTSGLFYRLTGDADGILDLYGAHIDSGDLAVLGSHYDTFVGRGGPGDLNGDGYADSGDLGILGARYGISNLDWPSRQ